MEIIDVHADLNIQPKAYSGVGRRFLAMLLDSILMWVVQAIATYSLLSDYTWGLWDSRIVVTSIVLNWLYEALFISSRYSATPGKMAMDIKVVAEKELEVSFGRASIRHFSKYVSACILLIGYLMAFFTSKKQALHDMMAGTVVIIDKN